MKKITAIIAMTILLVFLAGCSKQDKVSITGTFIGGTQGLETSFQAGSPPPELFQNTTFDINTKIQNMGETEVNASDLKVTIVGLYAPDFGKTPQEFILNAQEPIASKIKTPEGNVLDGGITNVIFSNLRPQGALPGDQVYNARLDVCYKYQTRTVSKVCVLQDLLRESETSFCKINEAKEVQNSAGPLQVTKVTESRSGNDKIAMTIEINNAGTGKTYKQNSECNGQDYQQKDKVYVTVDTGVQPAPVCAGLRDEAGNIAQSNAGYITLDATGKTTITCTQQVSTNVDFEKIVNIKLDYNYGQEQPFSVLVKDIE